MWWQPNWVAMEEIDFVAVSIQQTSVGESLLLLNVMLGKMVFKEKIQGENFIRENTGCCE